MNTKNVNAESLDNGSVFPFLIFSFGLNEYDLLSIIFFFRIHADLGRNRRESVGKCHPGQVFCSTLDLNS